MSASNTATVEQSSSEPGPRHLSRPVQQDDPDFEFGGRRPIAEPPPPNEVQAGPEPAPGTVLIRAADGLIGSGVLLDDTVATQPIPGNYQAFSVICTHTGCAVDAISAGTIN